MERRWFVTNNIPGEQSRFDTLEGALNSAREKNAVQNNCKFFVLEIVAHTHIPPQAVEIIFTNRELQPIPEELENEMMNQLV